MLWARGRSFTGLECSRRSKRCENVKVASALWRDFFSQFGCPEKMHVGRGTENMSDSEKAVHVY